MHFLTCYSIGLLFACSNALALSPSQDVQPKRSPALLSKSAPTAASPTRPKAETWVKGIRGGAFAYLERNANATAPSVGSGIGYFSSARSSATVGTEREVGIPFASFVHNDRVGGLSGLWNIYGTALRESGALGPTHNIEIDIANTGNTVALYPSRLIAPGLTAGLWVASGGEVAGGLARTASVGLAFLSNDPTATANFEKGIIFQNRALAGTDGLTGEGTAIALSARHFQRWYGSADKAIASIGSVTKDGGGTLELSATNGSGGPVKLAINAYGDNSFAPEVDGAIRLGGPTKRWEGIYARQLDLSDLHVHPDNAAAVAHHDRVGQVYRTATGQLMVRY